MFLVLNCYFAFYVLHFTFILCFVTKNYFATSLLKQLLYAEKYKGAFLNNQQIKVSEVNDISKSWICHGGINHFQKKKLSNNLAKLSADCGRIRGLGDYWMYQLLSQGKFDIVLEAKIKFWDVAPFKIIIEEAGGKMTDIYGKQINKTTTTVLATNKKLHNKVLRYFE